MTAYILRRLLGVVAVVAATTVLIFGIVHILPGNVAYAILGEFATPSAVAALEVKLGLHDPLWLQYWHWLSGLLHGDLGQSLTMDRPAGPVIAEAVGRSAILAGFAFALVAVGGIGLGVHAATHAGRPADHVLGLAQLIFIGVPDFFWAILVILVFASMLGWLPATGYSPISDGFGAWVSHLVLPVLVLAVGLIAHVSRLTRAAMLEALRSRYVLMARAKGLSERRVLWRHAAPNAMLPAITILAIDFGLLIGGVVVIETVFAIPGLGRLLVFAIEHHDLPLLQAGMLVLTTIYALANLAADLAYAALNPRIRYTASA
ncbi:ABC transporter permease [Acidisphaera sp. L21]|uniref:ABC transporter permease n=1 Tax=Acidisphaera sp. L21 TaxID=1641851 RepID=UPI00131BBA97|nr:ABC transporter permease [Acidisphaera sp. L21]